MLIFLIVVIGLHEAFTKMSFLFLTLFIRVEPFYVHGFSIPGHLLKKTSLIVENLNRMAEGLTRFITFIKSPYM